MNRIDKAFNMKKTINVVVSQIEDAMPGIVKPGAR
jgi:hypothetical protein